MPASSTSVTSMGTFTVCSAGRPTWGLWRTQSPTSISSSAMSLASGFAGAAGVGAHVPDVRALVGGVELPCNALRDANLFSKLGIVGRRRHGACLLRRFGRHQVLLVYFLGPAAGAGPSGSRPPPLPRPASLPLS